MIYPYYCPKLFTRVFFKFIRVPSGLDDVSYFPNLFARMLERGWQKSDLIKIAGENLLRVFSDVEEVEIRHF